MGGGALRTTEPGEGGHVSAGAQAWPPVPMWNRRVPGRPGTAPLLWLVGTHGGAGVTSLATSISFAGDAERRWPGQIGSAGEVDSPFVVLVARTHMSGL